MSGNSSGLNDFKPETIQKTNSVVSPRSVYTNPNKTLGQNSFGSKKKSNLPEIEKDDKLKFSPREKLRSSKMD